MTRPIPPSVERAIAEAIRTGPGTNAPTLEQLAYIYGPGTKKVTDAVDRAIAAERERTAERAAHRGLQREINTRLRWAMRGMWRDRYGR